MARGNRSGIYIPQPGGYSTFKPAPLPPIPPINLDNNILRHLTEAERALARLDGLSEMLPNPDLFVAMYIRKEAVLSSQIEGTQASLEDVLEAEVEALHPERNRDVVEVMNYVRALNRGLEMVNHGKPLNVELIKLTHKELLSSGRGSDRRPGSLRGEQNWIGPTGCKITDSIFVPPTVNDMKRALTELTHFIARDKSTPDLVKTALVHYQFETIHPFCDGNGRIGRLLIPFLLTRDGLLHRPVLYISYFFTRHKQEYYSRLQTVRDNGEFEKWLDFFLTGVKEVSLEASDKSKDITNLHRDLRSRVLDNFGKGSGNALKVLDMLFQKPMINSSLVKQATDLSSPASHQLLNKLIEMGILNETTGRKRKRIYSFDKYLEIMNK
jgi:Fic family protein